MRRHSMVTLGVIVALYVAPLPALWAATANGLILGNATTSVARGLYMRTDMRLASHVTFCLGKRHGGAAYYPWFCSPDNPDGTAILKRIKTFQGEDEVIVEGDVERALDSRFLGPIRVDEVTGWWRPLVQFPGTANEQ